MSFVPPPRRGDAKLRRALAISIALSVVFTVVLSRTFGPGAYGLFFLLPLGVLIARSRKSQVDSPNVGQPRVENKPIEPK